MKCAELHSEAKKGGSGELLPPTPIALPCDFPEGTFTDNKISGTLERKDGRWQFTPRRSRVVASETPGAQASQSTV